MFKQGLLSSLLLLAISSSSFATTSPGSQNINTHAACVNNLPDHMFMNYLQLSKCAISDSDISNIAHYINENQTITRVDLSDNTITDAGLVEFSKQTNRDLDELYLDHNNIGDQGLASLVKFNQLNTLIVDNTNITSNGLGSLAKLPHLTRLAVSGNHLDDHAAVVLSKFSNLADIEIANNAITDSGVESFKNLKKLYWINLINNKVTDTGVISIAKNHPELAMLLLGGNNVTEVGAKAISSLKNLDVLHLDSNIDDKGVYWIATLPELHYLTLDNSQLTDTRSLEALARMPLIQLFMTQSSINDAGVAVLNKSKTLDYLGLSYNLITDKGAATLAKNPRIRGLDLSHNRITDQGAIELARHKPENDQFALSLAYNKIGLNGLRALAGSSNINLLDLSGNKIDDYGVAILATSKSIVYLNLESNNIGDMGATLLGEDKYLGFLFLANNNIGDEGAIGLAKTISLSYLDVKFNHIGRAGLDALLASKTITTLLTEGNDDSANPGVATKDAAHRFVMHHRTRDSNKLGLKADFYPGN